MKKIIIIIALLFIVNNLIFAQDFMPQQRTFTYNTLVDKALTAEDFPQRKFLLGWHWSNGKRMSDALRCTQAHVNESINFVENGNSQYRNGIDLIITANGLRAANNENLMLNTRAMQFTPALLIDDSKSANELQTNTEDSQNPVFGFREINEDAPLDIYKGSIILNKNNLNIIGEKVLARPWPDYMMHYDDINTFRGNFKINELDYFNGESIYLSIHIKSIENNLVSGGNDEQVLRIKVPYILENGSGALIKFDKKPSTLNYPYNFFEITDVNGVSRGKASILEDCSNYIIYITQKMLPANGEERTIRLHFTCDNVIPKNNYRLVPKSHGNDKGERIRSLGLDVEYIGNSSVEINWFRFETPAAQDLACGVYDNEIQTIVQRCLTKYDDNNFKSNGILPFRFYLCDEPNPAGWFMIKYFNNLVGNIGTQAFMHPEFQKQYEHYTDAPEHWIETLAYNDFESVPYATNNNDIDSNDPNINALNLRNTFDRIKSPYKDQSFVNDMLNSGYETSTFGTFPGHFEWGAIFLVSFNKLQSNDIFDFAKNMDARNSYQACVDRQMLSKYMGINSLDFMKDFGNYQLFSDKPWWAQLFLGSNSIELYDPDDEDNSRKKTNMKFNILIPKTGESFRKALYMALIMGAKGLVYDREQSDCPFHFLGAGYGEIHYAENFSPNPIPTSDWEFLRSDNVGSDFINENERDITWTDKNNIDHTFNLKNYVNISEVSQIQGVPADRIYIGRKSVRCEIKKIHDYVLVNNDLLMDLRLVSWHGKGFANRNISHIYDEEKFGNDPIKDIINLSDIRTRPLGREKNGLPHYEHGLYNYNFETPYDSSFYDITMLRHKDDMDLQNYVYIGVLNRRTDPTIRACVKSHYCFFD